MSVSDLAIHQNTNSGDTYQHIYSKIYKNKFITIVGLQ